MKNRLTRIKTTYTDSGDYNRQQYFQEQKSVYQREINFATRVSAITEQQFGLKPLEIGFLNSSVLKDEQKFKDIKKIMMDYNRSVVEHEGRAINGLHLKTVVMECMLKFMRLMMMAPDAGTKKLILDIAHHWFISHLDPKSGQKSTADLHSEIKKILVQKQLLPIDIINKQLILTRVEQTLRPYKMKARTMYKQIDAPEIELQNYHTHKLEFLGNHMSEVEQKKNQKWIDTVRFPKIDPPGYYYEPEEPEKPPEEAKPQDQQIGAAPQAPAEVKLDADGKPIPPPVDPLKEDENVPDYDFGGGGGEPQDQQPGQEAAEQEDTGKQRGKLDPLLKIFLLERIRNKQKQQVSCDRRNELRNNRLNKTQLQDYSEINFMKNWAAQKARLKTEISKKHQSMRGKFEITRGKGESKLKYLQNQMDILRVARTTKHYEKAISKVEQPADELNSQAGLSLFDRRRVKTEVAQKPYSAVIGDHCRAVERNEILDDISYLKDKLAKHRIYAPMQTLTKGLVHPLQKDQQIADEQNGKIVWPNSEMLSNPFFKVAKKKKKKKKK